MNKIIVLFIATIAYSCSNKQAVPDTQNDQGITTFSWGSGLGTDVAQADSEAAWDSAARMALKDRGNDHHFPRANDSLSQAKLARIHRSKLGPTLVEYRQEIGGIPVFNGKLTVVINQDGKHVATSGSFQDTTRIASREFTLSKSSAFSQVKRARKSLSFNASQASQESSGKKIYFPKDGALLPAYDIESFGEDGILRKFIVDAKDGAILETIVMTVQDNFNRGDIR